MWQFSDQGNTLFRATAFPEILKRPELFKESPKLIDNKQEEEDKKLSNTLVRKVKMKPRLPSLQNVKKNDSQQSIKLPQQISQKQFKVLSPPKRIEPQPMRSPMKTQSNPQRGKNTIQKLILDDEQTVRIIKKPKVIDDYEIHEIIGQGSYAVVRKAISRTTGQQFAIKMYVKERLFDPQRARSVAREIGVLKQCTHRNIIQLIKVVETQKYISLVMEHGGDLSLKKLSKTNLDLMEVQRIFKQLISAVNYLHANNIIHRDIKLENVLYNNKEIKLIDFGFATEFNGFMNLTYGTPSYMSPEILPPMPKYNEKSDIWSCGVLLYVLIYGKFPFYGATEKELQYKIKKSDPVIENIGSEVEDVLRSCLNKEHEKRKSAADLLRRCLWFQTYY
ncbi:hypothetical protein pb186bvf_014056 [Paramecium bursaria]